MAVSFKEQDLPESKSLAFDITHWGGVNKIKGSAQIYEFASCKNMSSERYPYTSPKKPLKRIVSEEGIKRIYKVSDEKVYCIDKNSRLCFFKDGEKELLTYTDGDVTENICILNCDCVNNYDDCSIFYPETAYTDYEGNLKRIGTPITLTPRFTIDRSGTERYEYVTLEEEYLQHEYKNSTATQKLWNAFDLTSAELAIENLNATSFTVCFNLPESSDRKYEMPIEGTSETKPEVRARIYDRDGKIKFYSLQNEDGTVTPKEIIHGYFPEVNRRYNFANVEIPEEITLEKGDYMVFTVGFYSTADSDFGNSAARKKRAARNAEYISKADWSVASGTDGSANILGGTLEMGTVYQNRVVGVCKNEIRASALGDFSNFTEFADEAGNPSATGAYATDVGSEGEFLGVCVYQNVILLLKRNIVYEMYGNMPYTVSELCKTGCIDNDSIVEIDGRLYWASPKGIVCYSGGVPTVISQKIDIDLSGKCKAGTDGVRYYAYDGEKIHVYDTYRGVWHTEEANGFKSFYSADKLYMLFEDGIYVYGGEGRVEWEFETTDFNFATEQRKNLSKLWVRAEMKPNTELEIFVRQDGGEWRRSAVKTAEREEMFDFKLRVKKCDSFALKFKGRGDISIADIHGRVSIGTSKHRSGASLNVYRR